MGFTEIDYLVLFAYLLGTAALGNFLGRGQRNIRDYFLGGGQMSWWAICLSIVATETSTLTFVGAPALAYGGDLTFLQLVLGYCLGRVLVSLILIPSYFQEELQTVYQLLHFQFGPKVRSLAAGLFQLTRSLADGVRLFATALVLSVVTGISDVWTVTIIGGATVLYTFYGGMRAVVWNDVIQLVIYIGGALLAFFTMLEQIPGGWSEVVAVAGPLEKFRIFDFSFNWSTTYNFWAGVGGGTFLTLATHGTDQMMVQRYLACGRVRASQIALVFSGVLIFAQFLLFLLIGIMLFVFYQHFPMAIQLDQTDRIFPTFIVHHLPQGVSGLVIAGIFAAAMSTLSSSLNSLASSSVNDFYRNYFTRVAPDSHYLMISRIFTLIWGAILIGIALLARDWGQVLEAGLMIASLTMGSVLGIFLLGTYTDQHRQRSALAGMICGLSVTITVHLMQVVAWTWYVLIATIVTFVVGAILAGKDRATEN